MIGDGPKLSTNFGDDIGDNNRILNQLNVLNEHLSLCDRQRGQTGARAKDQFALRVECSGIHGHRREAGSS